MNFWLPSVTFCSAINWGAPPVLEHIEKLSLALTSEVSLAALKSFHEMVVTGEDTPGDVDSTKWQAAWKSWASIGRNMFIINDI